MTRTTLPAIAGLAAITLAFSLSACMTTPPPDGPPPPMAGACNAEAAQAAIGKAATPDVVEQARVDAGADVARVLVPGQVVTMEFLAGRLNVNVNERNAVVGLTCG